MEAFQPLPSVNGNNRVGLLDRNGAYIPAVRMCDLGSQLADRVVGDEELGQAIAAETRNRVPDKHWRLVKKNARHPWGYYLHESHADIMIKVARDTTFIEQARKDLTRNKSIAVNRKKVRLREEQTKMSLPTVTYEALGGAVYRGRPVDAILIKANVPLIDGSVEVEIEAIDINGLPHLYSRSLERAFRPGMNANANLLRTLRSRLADPEIGVGVDVPGKRGRAGFALPCTLLDDILAATPVGLHVRREVQEELKRELARVCNAWSATLKKPGQAPVAVDPFPPAPTSVEAPKRSASEMFDRLERIERRLDQALGENAMLLGRIDQFTTIFGQLKELVGVNAKALNDCRLALEGQRVPTEHRLQVVRS